MAPMAITEAQMRHDLEHPERHLSGLPCAPPVLLCLGSAAMHVRVLEEAVALGCKHIDAVDSDLRSWSEENNPTMPSMLPCIEIVTSCSHGAG
mmetsp:Transcript_38207/g.114132  ORF Transcript_38207/g.114132 Transcript_38207/m.114132 type:complete len:93 (-) Transcript_38207:602-880(-)